MQAVLKRERKMMVAHTTYMLNNYNFSGEVGHSKVNRLFNNLKCFDIGVCSRYKSVNSFGEGRYTLLPKNI